MKKSLKSKWFKIRQSITIALEKDMFSLKKVGDMTKCSSFFIGENDSVKPVASTWFYIRDERKIANIEDVRPANGYWVRYTHSLKMFVTTKKLTKSQKTTIEKGLKSLFEGCQLCR